MSAGKKVRKAPNSESSGLDEKEIQVEFEAFPLDESDFGGISALLKQMLGSSAELDFGGLASVLIAGSPIGSVLKPSGAEDDMEVDVDEDAVFGVSSALDLGDSSAAVSGLLSYLRERVGKAKRKSSGSELALLKSALEGDDESGLPALLVSERFLNIPHQVALPSLNALLADLETAGKSFPVGVLLLLKLHVGGGSDAVVYAQAEEELAAEDSSAWAEWWTDAKAEQMSFQDGEFQSKRRLCLLSHSQLLAYRNKMAKEFGQ